MTVIKQYDAATQTWLPVGGCGIPMTPCGFSASKTADQAYSPAGSYVKVTFGQVDWNVGGCYDSATSRFTPNVAGTYLVTVNVTDKITAGTRGVSLYKNGVAIRNAQPAISTSWLTLQLTALVPMNGSTDYVEAFYWHASQTGNLDGDPLYTFFQAILVPSSYSSGPRTYDLASAKADVLLLPGDVGQLSYSAATSVPLRVATVEGLYEMDVVGYGSTSNGVVGGSGLLPNNVAQTAGIIDLGQGGNSFGPSQSGSVSWSSIAEAAGATSFWLGDGLIVRSSCRITTYTQAKTLLCNSIGISDTSFSRCIMKRDHLWADDSTAWLSLGTVTFPVARSGTIVVRRLA